jgi:hypothetical protein
MRDFAGQRLPGSGNETVALRNQSVPTDFELAECGPLAWFFAFIFEK